MLIDCLKIRSFSFIGRKIIECNKNIQIENIANSVSSRTKNNKITPIISKIRVSGPLGYLDFPLHQGLQLKVEDTGEDRKNIGISLRDDSDYFNTHQKMFLKAMWGTSRATLLNNIEGVSKVHSLVKFIRDTT